METKFYLENMLDLAMRGVPDLFSVPKRIVRIPGNALANETSDLFHVKPKKRNLVKRS